MCDGGGEVSGGIDSDPTSEMAKDESLGDLTFGDCGLGQSTNKWIGRLNHMLVVLCIVMLVMILL